jgi:hypothetical protein
MSRNVGTAKIHRRIGAGAQKAGATGKTSVVIRICFSASGIRSGYSEENCMQTATRAVKGEFLDYHISDEYDL